MRQALHPANLVNYKQFSAGVFDASNQMASRDIKDKKVEKSLI
jgi:hypothetical protein